MVWREVGSRSTGSCTEAEVDGRQETAGSGGVSGHERETRKYHRRARKPGGDGEADRTRSRRECRAAAAVPTGASATTILEWLDERHPVRFGRSQLRTLQRGSETTSPSCPILSAGPPLAARRRWILHGTGSHHRWRALQTPAVPPGAESWRYAEVCFGEKALVQGLQGAVGAGRCTLRTDNLSAATHDLKNSSGRADARYEAVLTHYEVESTRINPRSHENGVVEQGGV